MIQIEPIKPHQILEVKSIIFEVCQEIFKVSEDIIRRYNDMSDLNEIKTNYFYNLGIFFVVLDRERVVGSGAIKRFDRDICELKRMWFLKEDRGQGYSTKSGNLLLKFAK